MAGDKGVEPLQTRSQSPARYHYANPQYKAEDWNRTSIVTTTVAESNRLGNYPTLPF